MMSDEDRRRVELLSALGEERMKWLRGLRSAEQMKRRREALTVVDGGRWYLAPGRPRMRGKLAVVPRWQPVAE
jgi:hypothetical protein